MHPRRQQREGYALMLLISQMAQIGFSNIPPVTLISIVGQAILYLRILAIPNRLRVVDVCISGVNVWYKGDWMRLLLGAVQHGDEWHLYYNMVSMLWKGRKIEQKIGSAHFVMMLLLFTPLVSLTLLALIGLSELVTNDSTYIVTCHVGFSGVLFALKVVLNYLEPDTVHYVLNSIPVSSSMICWVELVLIHFMVPNSSFLGHLAGILVGIWYVHGPLLKPAITVLSSLISDAFPSNYRANSSRHQSQGSDYYQDDLETLRQRRLYRFD